jgi:translation initiation factor 2 alpha subunit (eIF-2alpha)
VYKDLCSDEEDSNQSYPRVTGNNKIEPLKKPLKHHLKSKENDEGEKEKDNLRKTISRNIELSKIKLTSDFTVPCSAPSKGIYTVNASQNIAHSQSKVGSLCSK